MKNETRKFIGVILLLWAVLPADLWAQRGGGFGGGGRTSGGAGSAASRREYFSNGMIGEAMITADPETRRIIVIADEETNFHISQVITNLDQPKPQVLIKVLFVEVTYRDDSDIGVEGLLTHTVTDKDFGGTGTASTGFGGLGALAQGFQYQFISDDFELTLRAIKEAGKTEILSRPSILTRNNQEAVIIIGDEVPFITNSRITDQGQTVNTIQYDDVGIILRVTPYITPNGLVEMIVAPEISVLSEESVPISDNVNAPVINKRSAETVIVTEDGQTAVIGGLMQNTKLETVRKVPFLGSIPILGFPFRRTIKEDSKTELLIFLTPHVVSSTESLARMTSSESGKARITPKAFKQTELDRYIEGAQVGGPEESDKPVDRVGSFGKESDRQ